MAEGLLYVMREEEWAYSDVDPSEVGIRKRTLLGIPVLIAYQGDDSHDDFDSWHVSSIALAERLEHLYNLLRVLDGAGNDVYRARDGQVLFDREGTEREIATIEADPGLEHSRRCLEAQRAFQENAERIQAWT
jgi:hypothetical protein